MDFDEMAEIARDLQMERDEHAKQIAALIAERDALKAELFHLKTDMMKTQERNDFVEGRADLMMEENLKLEDKMARLLEDLGAAHDILRRALDDGPDCECPPEGHVCGWTKWERDARAVLKRGKGEI